MAKESTKKQVKKSTTKKPVKKQTKKVEKKVEFNKYSLYFQTISILLVLLAVTLNIAGEISTNIMLDLFCIAVIVLALSLFPKK